jgi:hypothetical protein
MDRRLFVCAAIASPLALQPFAAVAAQLPQTWGSLVLVKSKRLEAVYLLPGADFSGYDKVMLDPVEVSFQKDWLQNYNDQADFDSRLSEADAQTIVKRVRTGFDAVLAKAFTQAGYNVVTTPAKDVLRLRSAVVNLSVTAPAVELTPDSQVYSGSAGQATVVLEARDSVTETVLGRAEDAEAAGDSIPEVRNSVTNRADFTQVGEKWADACVKGLEKLKESSPFRPTSATAPK